MFQTLISESAWRPATVGPEAEARPSRQREWDAGHRPAALRQSLWFRVRTTH